MNTILVNDIDMTITLINQSNRMLMACDDLKARLQALLPKPITMGRNHDCLPYVSLRWDMIRADVDLFVTYSQRRDGHIEPVIFEVINPRKNPELYDLIRSQGRWDLDAVNAFVADAEPRVAEVCALEVAS